MASKFQQSSFLSFHSERKAVDAFDYATGETIAAFAPGQWRGLEGGIPEQYSATVGFGRNIFNAESY